MRSLTTFLLSVWVFTAAAHANPADSVAFARADWQTIDLGGGARCSTAQIDLFGARQTISVVSYPRKQFETRIVQLDSRGAVTSEFGRAAGADIALNGSYFNMKTLDPVTYVLVDGKLRGRTLEKMLPRTNGVVALGGRKGRKVAIIPCDTMQYDRLSRRYRSMLASGPVLITGGEVVEYDNDSNFFTGRHPRTLIGIRTDGEVVMAVIDGRFPGEGEGTTIAETARIAQLLGLVDALNLDGGGSSTLWTSQEGVINHPYDNHCFDHAGEGAVPNGIVARKKR